MVDCSLQGSQLIDKQQEEEFADDDEPKESAKTRLLTNEDLGEESRGKVMATV